MLRDFNFLPISHLFIRLLVFLVFFVLSVFFMGVLPMIVVFCPLLVAVVFPRFFKVIIGFYAICILFFLGVVIFLSALYPKSYSMYDNFSLVGFGFTPKINYEIKGDGNFAFYCENSLASNRFDCHLAGEQIFTVSKDKQCYYYLGSINGNSFLGVGSHGACSISFSNDLKGSSNYKLVVSVNFETFILYFMIVYSLIYCLISMLFVWFVTKENRRLRE